MDTDREKAEKTSRHVSFLERNKGSRRKEDRPSGMLLREFWRELRIQFSGSTPGKAATETVVGLPAGGKWSFAFFLHVWPFTLMRCASQCHFRAHRMHNKGKEANALTFP